jgi:hypothetical protein
MAAFHDVEQARAVIQVDSRKQAASNPGDRKLHWFPLADGMRLRQYQPETFFNERGHCFSSPLGFFLCLVD